MSRARDLAKAGGVQQRLVGFSSHVGISTFAANVVMSGDLSVAGDLNVTGDLSYDEVTAGNQRITGISTLTQVQATTVQVSAGFTAATAQISDLTSGRVVVAGTNGALGDSGSLTFSGGTLTATTFSGNLPTTDLTGTITNAQLAGSIANSKLSNDSVSFGGVSVDLGASDATPAFDLSDATAYPTSSLTGTITNAQLAGSIANSKLASPSASIGGVTITLGGTDATPAFDLSDATDYPTSSLTGTITNAQLAGSIANDKLSNSSATVTAGSALTGGGTLTLGSSVTLNVGVDDSSIEVSSDAVRVKASGVTNAMLAGSIANSKLSNSSVSYGGVSLSLGGSDSTPAFNLADASGLPVSSGIDGLGSGVASFLATPSSSNLRSAVTGETGSGALVFGTSPTISSPAISGGSFTGRQEIDDAVVSGGFVVGAGLTVTGDLVINGTTTTINSTTISVDDKHIELGATASPTDSSANGGGVILKGDSDHTILWQNDNDQWEFSEHVNLVSGKTFQIADASVLSATTLGSSVVSSSLTSVGTIASGVWNGTAITNANLANSSVSFGGISVALGAADATPAFDLSDATGLPTTSLTGTITNAQLAGSIANSKLSNSTVSYGGISLSLGGSDSTPAFDLADATNYPTSSLTGTITNAQLAGSIAAGKLAGSIGNSLLSNSSVSFGGVSLALGASDSTPAFDLSDATDYPTSSLSGTITNAQLAGSIANSKLASPSASIGGVTITLGGTDATPAFDLSDATDYPTSSLSGTITNAQLAGSIANGKLSNSSVQFGGITVSLGSGDSTPAFNLADATGLPISSGVSGLASNVATFLGTPSSANLRSAVTDETGSGSLVFGTSPTIAGMTVSDHVVPNANGTINLGASGTRFANVYSSDLDLSNEAKGVNTVDGTWGSYLIEEGEEHLYITNRRSGKKFRFMLEEV
jgi:hypothetical protein